MENKTDWEICISCSYSLVVIDTKGLEGLKHPDLDWILENRNPQIIDDVFSYIKSKLTTAELDSLEEAARDVCSVDDSFLYSDYYYIQLNYKPIFILSDKSGVEAILQILILRSRFSGALVTFEQRTGPGTVMVCAQPDYIVRVRKYAEKQTKSSIQTPQSSLEEGQDLKRSSSIHSLKQLFAKIKLVEAVNNPILAPSIRYIGYGCNDGYTADRVVDIFHDMYPYMYTLMDDIRYKVEHSIRIDMEDCDLIDLARELAVHKQEIAIRWVDQKSFSWARRGELQFEKGQKDMEKEDRQESDPTDILSSYLIPEQEYIGILFQVDVFLGKINIGYKSFEYDWTKEESDRIITPSFLNKIALRKLVQNKKIPYEKIESLVEKIKLKIGSSFFSCELVLNDSLETFFIVRCRTTADYSRILNLNTLVEQQMKEYLKKSKKTESITEKP